VKSRHLVEPEALEVIEQFTRPSFSRERLAELRALVKQRFLELRTPSPPGVTARRATAPGSQGAPDIPLIVYTPDSSAPPRAALLHIHGGGYVVGDADAEANWSEWLVAELGCVVVAPDYRLAPETGHPGPVEDCYKTLKWLHDQSGSLNVDRRRIGVYGGSAGGGLAAAVALLARDRNDIPLCMQCLLYPMLDDRTACGADPNPFAGEYVWTAADNAFGWECLLGQHPGLPGVSPYASPARATDLTALPPTYIWVGALDLFVDESIEYARQLLRAGVATELHVYPGVTHGNILIADAPSSQLCRADTLRALRRALGAGR
jgi:acetyl esterase/lipase